MQKPVGVIILAILEFLGAAGTAVVGLMALFGMGMLAQILQQNGTIQASQAPMLVGAGVAIGVICLIFAALFGFVGYGLLTLKNWARVIVMVFAVLGLAFGAIGLIADVMGGHSAAMVVDVIKLAINGLIFWYLNQPHIKASFSSVSAPMARSAGAR